MKLENRIAIVTGAAMGIGQAIAIRLAQEGANIAVFDIEHKQAGEVVNDIKTLGRKAIAIKADVSKSQEVEQGVEAVLKQFGKIDILVNNAGGTARERGSLFCKSTEEIWDFVIGINLKGVRNCTRAVINHMIDRRSGKIISIASVSGIIGTASVVDYSAAKGGIIAFSKALAKEVAPYRVNVNCVSPGPIMTRGLKTHPEQIEIWNSMTGLGRAGKPEEVAAVVAFLASEDADFITGQNYVMGGLSNLGGLI